ncbi:acyl carrier protein, partial [Streptomyces sp. NPDC002537]
PIHPNPHHTPTHPLLHTLNPPTPTRPTAHTTTTVQETASLEERLAPLGEEDRHRLLEDVICAEVAAVLGHADGSSLDPARSFQDSGFDSLTAVELRNRLKKVTGQRLPATLVFDYPTPQTLAKYLLEELLSAVEEIEARLRVPEADEEGVRRLLESVPLARIREAGLLDALLALAPVTPQAESTEGGAVAVADAPADLLTDAAGSGLGGHPDQSDAILAMDIDDLVREAFERSDSEQPE